jgi:hypothetical protein
LNIRLRCRQGEFALVLRSTDAGKLALADEGERAEFGIADHNVPVWRIDRDCMWAHWSQEGQEIPLAYAPDCALMPSDRNQARSTRNSAQEIDVVF